MDASVACCELLLWMFSLAQWLRVLLLLQVGVDVHGLVAEYKNRNMTVEPNSHSRWKHKWRWHNRGCVWDKIASDWAGHEEWSNNRQGTL